MSTLEQELVKDYAKRLRKAKVLLTAKTSAPDAPTQVVELLASVISDMAAYLDQAARPEPTTDEPDLETLEMWMFEDGGCEATDGCWVEPDGRCPHGHPSWLLVLGLI